MKCLSTQGQVVIERGVNSSPLKYACLQRSNNSGNFNQKERNRFEKMCNEYTTSDNTMTDRWLTYDRECHKLVPNPSTIKRSYSFPLSYNVKKIERS